MAKDHKYHASHLEADTGLSVDTARDLVLQLTQHKSRVRFEGRERDTLHLTVRNLLGETMLQFSVTVTAKGLRTRVETAIEGYITSQTTVLIMVPVGPKVMEGYKEYRKFISSLGAAFQAMDPTTVYAVVEREGDVGIATASNSSSHPVAAAPSAPAAPPAPSAPSAPSAPPAPSAPAAPPAPPAPAAPAAPAAPPALGAAALNLPTPASPPVPLPAPQAAPATSLTAAEATRLALDPHTSVEVLREIAQAHPSLRFYVDSHPAMASTQAEPVPPPAPEAPPAPPAPPAPEAPQAPEAPSISLAGSPYAAPGGPGLPATPPAPAAPAVPTIAAPPVTPAEVMPAVPTPAPVVSPSISSTGQWAPPPEPRRPEPVTPKPVSAPEPTPVTTASGASVAPVNSVAPASTVPPHTSDVPVVPASPVPSTPATAMPLTPPVEVDEEDEVTVVVHRRRPPQWRLVLEDGTSLPLDGNRVLVGRKPSSSDPDTVALPIPDSTMTLSKIHALLERVDDHWTITDLGSTNGVMLIQADGAELYLSPGTAAPLTSRFVLGKVTVSLYQED